MLKKTAVFVDVRDTESYCAAHIPGAVLVNDHNVVDFIKYADKFQTHILFCYHGFSSQGEAYYFKENGFADVYIIDGWFTEC